MLPHFRPVVLTLSHQKSGQGGSERLHKNKNGKGKGESVVENRRKEDTKVEVLW